MSRSVEEAVVRDRAYSNTRINFSCGTQSCGPSATPSVRSSVSPYGMKDKCGDEFPFDAQIVRQLICSKSTLQEGHKLLFSLPEAVWAGNAFLQSRVKSQPTCLRHVLNPGFHRAAFALHRAVTPSLA